LTPVTRASPLFSDSFSGGYSSSWYVPNGTAAPVPSSFGITGADTTTWSVIHLPITENYTYQIQFVLQVNRDNTNSAWGIGITNNAGAWKFAGNWGQQNLLQVHDSSGSNHLISWTHTPGPHHFEIVVSPIGGTTFIVKEDGTLVDSLISNANFDAAAVELSMLGNGDYEMANFVLSTYEAPTSTPTPTPSPTPTPTPTPSSTPTPTPSSTPTPTPSQPKKVIVLHGLGGSWNLDALINCKSTGYKGTWSQWKIANADVYQPLIDNLQQAGYQPLSYYFDWRQQATNIASQLASFIQNISLSDETIDMVGHSFGGLVGRAYLESTQTHSRLDKLLTVGSPHLGSVMAYPAWSAGEIPIEDPRMRLGFTIMKIGCALRNRWTAREMVANSIGSIQNMLPVFDYLKDVSGTVKPVSAMAARNNWLPTLFSSPYYGVTVGTLSGSGLQTLRWLEVKPPNKTDQRLKNWQDGKPTNKKTYDDGDGTVLLESSQLFDAQNMVLPLDHTALMTAPSGIDTIIGFLNGAPMNQPLSLLKQREQTVTEVKNTTALLIVVDNAHATLTDKDGNVNQDSEGQITILNPQEETYTLSVIPDIGWWWKKKYRVIVVQLFDDGTSKWKEYSRFGLLRKHFKLRFDRARKNEDILREK